MSRVDRLLARLDDIGRRLADVQFQAIVAFGIGETASPPLPIVQPAGTDRSEHAERGLGSARWPAGTTERIAYDQAAAERAGDFEARVDAIEDAIEAIEERGLFLSDPELDRVADVADDAYERGLRGEELVAVLIAAADQVVAARGA
jgi:hypothetical protein